MNSHLVMGFLIGSNLVNMVLMLVFLPLIFWVFVIPKIEDRIVQKLKFHPQYDLIPFGKYFFGSVEVGYTISLMYFSFKIFDDVEKIKFDKNRALVNAKYDIRTASKSELVINFVCFFWDDFFCGFFVVNVFNPSFISVALNSLKITINNDERVS